ncbi:uncharacterized protein LOC125873791 [Solanum stenotomum]|uniref:uncharacterized protein LOC125873791 n=1 Tax=Solanum stenotomum TaxID=172797 RepID=UPI0020D00E78|nr:uncharacterized protein LOC125873791 [Solanum stenotomum]
MRRIGEEQLWWIHPLRLMLSSYLQRHHCLLRPPGLQPIKITQAMLFKIGHLAHSADVRASRLEARVPWMIEWDISATLTPLWMPIDALTTSVEICERGKGVTFEVMALKAKVSDLKKDVDYQSTDFTLLFDSTEAQGVPTSSVVPLATTRDEPMDDVAGVELEPKTDEEQLEAQEATIYKDLPNLEETIV